MVYQAIGEDDSQRTKDTTNGNGDKRKANLLQVEFVDGRVDVRESSKERIQDCEAKSNIKRLGDDDRLCIQHMNRTEKGYMKHELQRRETRWTCWGLKTELFGVGLKYSLFVGLFHSKGKNVGGDGKKKNDPLRPAPAFFDNSEAPNQWTVYQSEGRRMWKARTGDLSNSP